MSDTAKYRSYSKFEEFLHNFYSLSQTARIHSENHTLVLEGIEKFFESINNCMENESLTFKISNDQLYVDDEKLAYNRTTKNLFDNIIRYFDARGLDGVRLLESVKQASAKNILAFMRLLDISGQQPEPLTWLKDGLAAENIQWVELIKKTARPQGEESYKSKAERRERARKDYTYAKASVEEVAQKIKDGKGDVGVRKTVRVVQDMVTNLIEDDEVYSAISTLREFDDYTYTHSVNVAMLSMCIGRRINLSRRNLVNLGMCALFHDLGKIEIPNEVLHKKEKLNVSEKKLIEEHSLNSSRLLLKLKASPDSKARLLVPMFEHHLKYDLSGYPHADGYMFDRAGKDFDPTLIKVFINIMGVYPVGTLMKLDTGELALVVSSPSREFSKRPLVCTLEKESDGSYKKKEIINLDERDTETGSYIRGINETYHPANLGIQPVQHIFSSN
jgi:HD-GYP domain-containing protein (c-di-GMP phosphodiesterase class II)